MSTRLLIVGLGDLGTRIALRLAQCRGIDEIVVAGHRLPAGTAKARLIEASGDVPVRFETVDGLDVSSIESLIVRMEPSMLVQAASLHSPWLLAGREDAVARAFRAAGFAVQLPAQLPILTAVMHAVRACGYDRPVVNCSYPDATHAMLQPLGLAPTIGIGNAGMIHRLFLKKLGNRAEGKRLRTIAHHAHVPMVTAANMQDVAPLALPYACLDAEPLPIETLVDASPLPATRELNELTAAHAIEVILALHGLAPELATAAPGVEGLPGGWPVVVCKGAVALDLPRGVDREVVLARHAAAARLDGIADLDANGTVSFTAQAREALSNWPALTASLRPLDALPRHGTLITAMQSHA